MAVEGIVAAEAVAARMEAAATEYFILVVGGCVVGLKLFESGCCIVESMLSSMIDDNEQMSGLLSSLYTCTLKPLRLSVQRLYLVLPAL
jgi:hypothetical protein